MRLGLIAAARITERAIADPARDLDDVTLAVVGARDLARAQQAATNWNVERAVGSYEQVIESDDIDAVYIATPNALHRKWAIDALRSGKHVLCEKPLASNAAEAREMVSVAEGTGLILMEAFHWRYHPLVAQMQAMLDAGVIGGIEGADAAFDLADGRIPITDIRWDYSIAGGSLMDLGCYPVQWLRWLFGPTPAVVSATAVCPIEKVDGRIDAELRWPDGRAATLSSSMIEPNGRNDIRLSIYGSEGTMTVKNPLAPQMGSSITIERDGTEEVHGVDSSPSYFHQLVAFYEAVITGVAPITSGDDSIQTMDIVDAIYSAAGLGPRQALSH
jgi:predicted dehydrogenase